MGVWQGMLGRLTDAYDRTTDSRLARLLRIAGDEIQELQDNLHEVHRQRDIDQAVGATLDRAGFNVQQFRGPATDPVFRLMIKSKIARNRSTGDVNTIIEVLASTLSTAIRDIKLTELWAGPDGEPAALHIQVPTESLNRAGMSVRQFGQLIQRVVAAGVRTQAFIRGTFIISTVPDAVEVDQDYGLAPLDQSTGGKLGSIYDPCDCPDLPL